MKWVAIFFVTLFACQSWSGSNDEIEFVEVLGDCQGLNIVHQGNAGEPLSISIDDMDIDVVDDQPQTFSCLLIYEVNLPEGYQVGITGMKLSGDYSIAQNAWSRVKVSYKFATDSQRVSIDNKWVADTQGETPYLLASENTVLWSSCNASRLFILPELLGSPVYTGGESTVRLSQIDLDHLIYKRCS